MHKDLEELFEKEGKDLSCVGCIHLEKDEETRFFYKCKHKEIKIYKENQRCSDYDITMEHKIKRVLKEIAYEDGA